MERTLTHLSLTYWAGLWLSVGVKCVLLYGLAAMLCGLLSRDRPAWRAFVWLSVIGSFGWLTLLEWAGGGVPVLFGLAERFSGSRLQLVANGYAIGVAILAGLIVHSMVRLHLMRAYASPLPIELTMPDRAAASVAVELLKRIRLCSTAQTTVPTSFGILRPAIALPAAPAGTIQRRFSGAAVIFELVTILRFDALWTLLVRLVQCAYFANPVVWLAYRHHCLAREQTCDCWTIRTTADTAEHEMHLTAMGNALPHRASLMSLDTPMIATGPSGIRKRIASLQSDDRPQSVRPWPGIGVLVAGLSLLAVLAAVGGSPTHLKLNMRPLAIGLTAAIATGAGLSVIVLTARVPIPTLLPPVDGLAGRSRYTLTECVERLAREWQEVQLTLGLTARRFEPFLLVLAIVAATILLTFASRPGPGEFNWPAGPSASPVRIPHD